MIFWSKPYNTEGSPSLFLLIIYETALGSYMDLVLVSTMGIFLFGGLIQGITGFGAALILVPMLCLVISIKQAVLLTILNALVMLSYQMAKLRYDLSPKKLLPLILGGLPSTWKASTVSSVPRKQPELDAIFNSFILSG